jgi:hypothetical protein
MARSRASKPAKKISRLVYAIPLIALVVIAAFYADSVLKPAPSTVAMDFTDELLISVDYSNGTRVGFVDPTRSIGEAGGLWQTHQFDSYGLDGHYPVYMDDPSIACPPNHSCTIHVRSNVVHAYTLGDFMAVYGYPVVSQNDTLGVMRNGNFAWESCVGTPGHATYNPQWGALVLRSTMALTLVYYDTVTGAGCA